MKLGILILFICLSAKNVNAQLQDTAWKGVFSVPDPTESVFEFRKDTVYLRIADGFKMNSNNKADILETSVYTTKDDTVTVQKISGGSPCGTEEIGKYRFEIKDEKLSIILIEDSCDGRSSAIPSEPLTKVKQ